MARSLESTCDLGLQIVGSRRKMVDPHWMGDHLLVYVSYDGLEWGYSWCLVAAGW